MSKSKVMIEHLLKCDVPRSFGLDSEDVLVPMERFNHPFVEADSTACSRCKDNPQRANRQGCNEAVLKVNNGHEIVVVKFEEYTKQFDHTPSAFTKRCDLLLVDAAESHEKIVFCDMGCYDEAYVEPNNGKYPEGKRAYARQQMQLSIEQLLSEALMCVYILTFAQKVCLFAWRDYNAPTQPVKPSRGNARDNMQAFLTTASSMTQTMMSHYQVMDHQFEFMQIKYPAVYVW